MGNGGLERFTKNNCTSVLVHEYTMETKKEIDEKFAYIFNTQEGRIAYHNLMVQVDIRDTLVEIVKALKDIREAQ